MLPNNSLFMNCNLYIYEDKAIFMVFPGWLVVRTKGRSFTKEVHVIQLGFFSSTCNDNNRINMNTQVILIL